MPKVPTYDNFQVTPGTLPNATVNNTYNAERASMGGRQIRQMGQAIENFGQTQATIALDMQQQANQLRVDDALNKAKEAALRLQFDPNDGYTSQRGENALYRNSGKPLADEYADKLKEHFDGVASGLGNDAQRTAFSLASNNLLSSFKGNAIQYEGQQFNEYSMSVREGTIRNRVNEIALNYNNPKVIDNAIQSIGAAVYDQGRLMGKSAEWVEAQTRDMTSSAHVSALTAAMEKNDPVYADGYMKKYSSQMTANDILKVNGVLTKQLDGQLALTVATGVIQGAQNRIVTPDLDRAFNIVLGTESGGKQFGGAGSVAGPTEPTTSHKGAIGVAQVMPTTGPEAAKIAGVPWDEKKFKEDPEYNHALGKAYFEQQLKDFGGSLAQACAAYNAGPGATRKAIAKADKEGGDWLAYMPTETQNYVQKNISEYEGGKGTSTRPTLVELQNQVRENLGTSNPSRLKMALDEVERQYGDITSSLKMKDEQAVSTAMEAALQNGGQYGQIPAKVRAAIPVQEVGKVMDFAAKIGKGAEVTTDWSLYYSLKSDPNVLKGTNLMAFRDKLSNGEFKQLADEQTSLRTGKAADDLRQRSNKDILNQFMREAGLNPNPPAPKDEGDEKGRDAAAKVGRIWNVFENKIAVAEEAQGGKKLGDEAVKKLAAEMFTNVDLINKSWFFGMTSVDSVPVAGLGKEDLEKLNVPETDRLQISKALQIAGLPVTQDNIKKYYVKGKGGDV